MHIYQSVTCLNNNYKHKGKTFTTYYIQSHHHRLKFLFCVHMTRGSICHSATQHRFCVGGSHLLCRGERWHYDWNVPLGRNLCEVYWQVTRQRWEIYICCPSQHTEDSVSQVVRWHRCRRGNGHRRWSGRLELGMSRWAGATRSIRLRRFTEGVIVSRNELTVMTSLMSNIVLSLDKLVSEFTHAVNVWRAVDTFPWDWPSTMRSVVVLWSDELSCPVLSQVPLHTSVPHSVCSGCLQI